MIRKWMAVLPILASLAACAHFGPSSPSPIETALWRLDCGRFDIKNLEGRGPVAMPVSCYLIRHGNDYLMFDAGLRVSLLGKPQVQPDQTLVLDRSLPDQLAAIGVPTSAIKTLVVSHYHGNHHGQADVLPEARLIIGRGDATALRGDSDPSALSPWLQATRPLSEVDSDLDVFGDGRVVVLYTPGHTPGHLSLLVRLAESAYILTGDAVHMREQLTTRQPSGNHVDKVKGVQSIDRLNALAVQTGAKIIVGHERDDVGLLPEFPAAAK